MQPTQSNPSTPPELSQDELFVLANGQALFFPHSACKMLINSRIYPKMIGLNSSSKNITEFVIEPYLLDKYSCAYLLKHKIMIHNQKESNQEGLGKVKEIQKNLKYIAYEYLVKERDLFLIDGHKFGGDFLAYEHNPDSNHATYLVFIKHRSISNQCSLDHISRLAGICKKQALVVTVNEDEGEQIIVECQEINPRFINDNKKPLPQTVGTQQVIRLKKMLGYKL